MTITARAGLRRMAPRDPHEPHRTASTLELFFDLTFVVGVSIAALELLHAEAAGRTGGVLTFAIAFFAIWWPWMNFTWFASAFDTDDWLYRVLTVLQMGGVLIAAAGLKSLVDSGDLTVSVAGYVVMRLALVAQWLRAARDPAVRASALRYAGGFAVVQLGWVLLLLAGRGPVASIGLPVLIAAELAVPILAERSGPTPFHRHHIVERYGLFTLIVLGEGLLSVTNALVGAQASVHAAELVLLGATALILIAGMWWIYFARTVRADLLTMTGGFAFGYLHYLVFGAAAALASGIELSIEHAAAASGHGEGAPAAAIAAATTVPLAVFLLMSWAVLLRPSLGPAAQIAVPVLAVAAGLAALLPLGLQAAALVVVMIVVVLEVDQRRPVRAPG